MSTRKGQIVQDAIGGVSHSVDQNAHYRNWRKARASIDQGGSCVEVAASNGRIGVRDSKLAGRGPVLEFDVATWRRFATDLRAGRFDRVTAPADRQRAHG